MEESPKVDTELHEDQTLETNHGVSGTLSDLVRVLAERGMLANFLRESAEDVARIEAIKDPIQRTNELAEFVEKFTKE